MENRNTRQEQYEEAALRLLMDEHSRSDGERLLRQFAAARTRGEAPAMTGELDRLCSKQIRKTFRGQQCRDTLQKVRPYAAKAAVCALVLTSLTATTILAAKASGLAQEKEPTWNGYFVSDHGDTVTVHFGFSEKTREQDAAAVSSIIAELVPDGYTCSVEYTTYSWDMSPGLYCVYRDADGNMIKLDTRAPRMGLVEVSKDGATVTEISYLGRDMALLENGSCRQVLWMDAEEGLYYSLCADALTEEEFWNMVNTLLRS